MRSGLKRAEKNEVTRRALLDAARRLFLEHGFHGTSLDAVADAAGLTKGAVYSRFESKADLFLALLDERIDQRIVQVASALGTGSDDGDIAAVDRQWMSIVRGELAWTLLVIEFRVHAARHPEVNQRYAAAHDRYRDGLIELARSTFGRRRSRAAVEAFIDGVLAFGPGIALEHAARGDVFAPGQLDRWTKAFLQEEKAR